MTKKQELEKEKAAAPEKKRNPGTDPDEHPDL